MLIKITADSGVHSQLWRRFAFCECFLVLVINLQAAISAM